MNKLFNKVAILAFGFGVAMSFTACHSGEGESESSEVIKTGTASYDLIVKTNVSATVTFDGKSANTTQAGNVYIFTDVNTNGTLVVSKAGYKGGYNGKVSFGQTTAKYVAVDLYADPLTDGDTPTAAQNGSATSDITLTNGSTNQSVNDNTVVTLNVPKEAADPTSGSDDDFSIYLFTPTNTEDTEDALANVNDQQELPVLGIACTPDGADWKTQGLPEEQWPTVTASLEKSNELNVKIVNSADPSEKLDLVWPNEEQPVVVARIPHFSSWLYTLDVKVVRVNTETVTVKSVTGTRVTKGRNQISYTRKVGVGEVSDNAVLIKKYVQSIFGENASFTSKFTFNANMAGVAEGEIVQDKKVYTLVSTNAKTGKSTEFTVTVWGGVKSNIVVRPATHSGGANN
jgi:hypothetical protein